MNFFRPLVCILIIGALFSSCVPNRKFVPLQYNDVNRKNLTKDSVLRTRPISIIEHSIKPGDQLLIDVETLTPDEYNFIKQLSPGNLGNRGMMGNMGLIGYFVDKEGKVTLPVIGGITLSGLTLEQAENLLKQALIPLLKDPIVRVRILNYRFTFTGQINTVVTAPVPRISLIEALSMAGGFDELSDRENIKILRQREDKMDVLYVNLLQEEFISSPNFWLQQGDIIIVPPLKQRTARQYLTQNIGLVVSLFTLVVSSVNLINR